MAARPREDDGWSPEDEFEGMNGQQVAERVYGNRRNWSDEQLVEIEEYIRNIGGIGAGTGMGGEWDNAAITVRQEQARREEGGEDPADPTPPEDPDVAQAEADAAQARTNDIVDGMLEAGPEQVGVLLNQPTALREQLEAAGVAPDQMDYAIEQLSGGYAELSAGDEDGDGDSGDEDDRELARAGAGGAPVDTDLPDWVYETARAAGIQISPGQVNEYQQRIVDYWRAWIDPEAEWEDVAPRIRNQQTGTVGSLIVAAVTETEPQQAWTVPGARDRRGNPIVLTQEQVEHAVNNLDMDLNAFARLVRIAEITSLGESPLAASDRAILLAGISKALGRRTGGQLDDQIGVDLAEQEELERAEGALEAARAIPPSQSFRDQAIREAEQRIEELTRARSGRAGGSAAAGAAATTVTGPVDVDGDGDVDQDDYRARREAQAGEAPVISGAGGIAAAAVAQNFQRGIERYNGDVAMASLFAYSPNLAAKVAAAGFDPARMSTEDMLEVGQVARDMEGIAALGASDVNATTLQFFENAANFHKAVTEGFGGGGGGGGGPQRRVLDPKGTAEQIKGLYFGMFRAMPGDALVEAFVQDLQAQLDASDPGMQFDTAARVKAWAEGLPIYEELYGNMPGHMQPEDYQAQFLAAESDMLGGEAATTDVVRAGMRTGSYQTTVGAIAGSKQAWNNSRYLERLARLADTAAQYL